MRWYALYLVCLAIAFFAFAWPYITTLHKISQTPILPG